MYRCTECYTEYEVCPDFCDCGNDTFEELPEEINYTDSGAYEYYEPRPKPKKKKRPLTEEEIEERRELEEDKKKAIVAIGVSLVLALIVLALPPHMPKKLDKAVQKTAANYKSLPTVDTYWINKPASAIRKVSKKANMPLLNNNLNSLSPVMKEYLGTVGSSFSRNWDSSLITTEGECRAEFTIDKEGNLVSNGIIKKSGSDAFDDSVLLLLSKVLSFDVPPDDYKGERIIIGFKKDRNGSRKVYYPTVK